ncbi:MAG: 5-methyltetrahydropteroyltriglutamate--homocysteine S-methyltransferase [Pseudorhodoplanes sp.]
MTTLPQGRPPFRADHIGSLLRPQVLRQAFRDHMGKRIDDAEFTKIQDACIRDVVKLQEDVGLKVVTDGEFRRGSYWGRFVERIDGFAIKSAVFKFRDDQGHQVDFTAPYAEGKLKRNKPLALDEFEFLKGITKATPKITLPAPSTMHFYRATDYATKSAYADVKGFFDDLNRIFREEIADLVKAGCKYIQLDEVAIALLCDPNIRKQVEEAGMKPDELVDLYIDSINESVKGAPADVVFGVHMCRGNFKGHYLGAGGYESVAERFFEGTKVNHFLLEYDTERAGDFRPLRFVKGKGVVLGLISSKTPVLESLDMLKRRTEEATQFIDLDRLAISPQCGFASTVAGNPVTEADERTKLELEVAAAKAIWG